MISMDDNIVETLDLKIKEKNSRYIDEVLHNCEKR